MREKMLADKNEETYFTNFENELNEETRYKMLEFALSDEVLAPVIAYYGVVPRINTFSLLLNIPRRNEGATGSREWHRDDGHFKSINLFMCINDVSEENGAYSAIGQRDIPRYASIPLETVDTRLSVWQRFRHSTELIRKYVPNFKVIRLEGKAGTAVFVDPELIYHKGGHCITKDRLMVQISYSLDKTRPMPSILDRFSLRNHLRVSELTNTKIKKLVTDGNDHRLFWKLGIKNPVAFIGSRILFYYLRKAD